MTIYKVDRNHKIEVHAENEHDWRCRFFERMVGRWVQLGEEEKWYSLDDIKFNYGID